MPYRLIISIVALSAAANVFADETVIDEIKVTASKRPLAASEIAAAITLIDGSEVRSQKLVTDAMTGVAGVSLQQTTPGQGAVIVRGLKGSSILHLVDGMRLNNAIFRSSPTQYAALVPTTAIERVEIIRGTPTSLYGSDAVGGVVQMVTRVPKFDTADTEFAGNASLGLDTAELTRAVRGTLDGGNERYVFSASAEYLQTGDRRIGGGERIGPSGYESKAGRLLFVATPTDTRRWLLDVHHLEQPDTPRVDELVPGFGQDEPSSSEFFFRPNRRTFVHGQFSEAEGWLGLDWTADLAWQRIDDDRTTRDFEAPTRRREANSSDLYGFSVSANNVLENGSWVVGAEGWYDEVGSQRTEELVATGDVQPINARFPDGSTVRQLAVFANGDIDIGSRNRLSGGLRLSDVSVRLPQTALTEAVSLDVTDASGDLGWQLELNDALQLVANAGFGFRAPNVFDIGTLGNRPGNRFNVPNPNLESERVTQFDIGLRYDNDGLSGELSIYALEYRDRITSVSTGDTTPTGRDVVQSQNAASARIRGAEMAAMWSFAETAWLRAALNYTRGEQRFDDGTLEPADRIPPFGGRLSGGASSGDFDWETWISFADNQDRLSARDIRDSRIDPNGTPGWGDIGALLRWLPSDSWTLTMSLHNVLDKRYRQHGSGLESPGRSLGLQIEHSWR